MARRGDPELSDLMENFVRVRVVQAWGMDLSLFQFATGIEPCLLLAWVALRRRQRPLRMD